MKDKFVSWYEDKAGVGLTDMVNISVNADEYADTARLSQLKAVMRVLSPAKITSAVMAVLGILLVIGLTLVSVTHVFEVLGAIKPANVAELVIPADVMHSAALAFTVGYDLALIYLLFVGILASFAGTTKPNTKLLSILTFALNALYTIKYFPGLTPAIQGVLVSGLTWVSALLIPVVFVLSLLKIKSAVEYCIASFIAIAIKLETYTDVLNTALESRRTELEQIGTETPNERLIKYLYDSGTTYTQIAKIMGGNYQKRTIEVKNLLGLTENTAE